MKKILLILFCLPMIGFGQSYATVKFISAETITNQKEEDLGEYVEEKIKLVFEEYQCSPECQSVGKLILFHETTFGEGSFPFFRNNLEIRSKSKYSSEHLFDITYKGNKFISISF
tara:strand:+ start:62 stop:406 length:345 start_codon:yes stop_codon:yes gene_type:complete